MWVVTAMFAASGFSQVNRQVIQASSTIELAKKSNRYTIERVDKASRGNIVSADNQVLAQTVDRFELRVDLRKIPHTPGFYTEFSDAAGVSAAELASAVVAGKKSIYWGESIRSDAAERIQDVKTKWRADGISLARTTSRVYPLGYSVASILGNLQGNDPNGGLEKSQNELLSGRDGKRIGLVDRTGAFLPMRMDRDSIEREDGENLQLTIHSVLQARASEYLKAAVESNGATSGVAIVLQPQSGDILAMANWPAPDPSGGRPILGFNQNYSSVYEPGSTFKILTLAKALQTGNATLDEHFHCDGEMHWGPGYRVRCDLHHGTRAHGDVDAEMVIAKSCNVVSATWARRMKYTEVAKYLKDLGLLSKSELGTTNEVAGQFNEKEYAKDLQIANVGFGQSISCTPLGLASAFSMLGNGGVRMKPRLVKSVGIQEAPKKAMGQIIDQKVADEVLHIMESVIETKEGTGKTLRIPGYRLAGKTGTAQKLGGGAKGYVSSFIGFVPAKNPQACILVMVDNPTRGKIYGAAVAGPVFRSLAEEVIEQFQIPPTEYSAGR